MPQKHGFCNFEVKFDRIELSLNVSGAEFRDLSFEKGPRLPGSHPDSKNIETCIKKKKKKTLLQVVDLLFHQVGRMKVSGAFDWRTL